MTLVHEFEEKSHFFKEFFNLNLKLGINTYICPVSKGVPITAEIKPIEPEQIMLLRERRKEMPNQAQNFVIGQKVN